MDSTTATHCVDGTCVPYRVPRFTAAGLDDPGHLAGDGEEEVDVNGAQAYLRELDGRISLRWSPGQGDSHAQLVATGLDKAEVLEFARDLEPVDADVQFPPTADDRFGFVLGSEETGLVEVPPSVGQRLHAREVTLGRSDGAVVRIQLDDRGEWYETSLYARPGDGVWQDDETIDVLGRRALLHRAAAGVAWETSWRHTEDAWATVTITSSVDQRPIDRSTVDQILANIEELPEPAWQDLLATTPPP